MARSKNYMLALTVSSLTAVSAQAAVEASQTARLPEEYLSPGEQSTAFANGGSLSSTGYSAVRSNPAMLANDRQYTVGGGYHWPVAGREYYQAGVVDSKTASVAAGLTYTSSTDDYAGPWNKDGSVKPGESPVKRRVGVALAQNMKNFSLGASGQFIEASDPTRAFDEDAPRNKGFTFGAGMIGGITPNLKFGLSVENLANKKIAYAAPTIYRAGLAWGVTREMTVYFDYRRREAVESFEASAPILSIIDTQATSASGSIEAEQSVIGGATVKVYDLIRLAAGAGASKAGSQTTNTIAGGVALVNKAFVLAYAAQRPDLKLSGVHHSVSLGIETSM